MLKTGIVKKFNLKVKVKLRIREINIPRDHTYIEFIRFGRDYGSRKEHFYEI